MQSKLFIFDTVDPSQTSIKEAYQWHCAFISTNNHVFPRTLQKYKEFAENGRLFCAKIASGGLVGLVYLNLDNTEWEIGGLMVSSNHLRLGIGSILMRFALGHLLFYEDPLDRNESVIAHVHEENQDPRYIIEHSIAFHHRKTISVDGKNLPGLKTDKNGKVNGDEFGLTIPDTLIKLAEWCEKWNGTIKQGKRAEIIMSPIPGVTLKTWAKAFRMMARR